MFKVANALFQATVSGIRQRELFQEYPNGYSLPSEDHSYIFDSWPFPEGTNVVDYCNTKTCHNNGDCYNDYTNFTYVCQCQEGYYGSNCDTINEPVVQFVRKWGHGGEFKVSYSINIDYFIDFCFKIIVKQAIFKAFF